MLLQVETYTDNSGSIATIFHPCLATADEDDVGCLFKAGRKIGDAIFGQDKSVSRQHCLLRCVGNLSSTMNPRTDEERQACSDSEYGMCLVLENSGKATYVAKEDTAPAVINDDSDTDDETDDEGISQQSNRMQNSKASTNAGIASPPARASTATRQFFGKKKVKLEEVANNQIFPISPEPIIIQLGREESTIKITSIPLRILASSLKNKTLPRELHKIGGLRVEDDANPTHLIAEELNAGAKQIIAWSKQIPMVRIDFLKALMDRKKATDPLPDPKNYPVLKNADNKIDFWSRTPNKKLLSKFTLLSLDSGSYEALARAAGANVVSLQEDDTEQAQLDHAKRELEKGGSIFFTSASRKRVSKKLSEVLGVPRVDLKKLAKAVTNQCPYLQDAKGSTIGDTESSEEEKQREPPQVAQKTSKEEVEESQDSQSISPKETQQETQCLLEPSQPVQEIAIESGPPRKETIPEEEEPKPDESFDQNMDDNDEESEEDISTNGTKNKKGSTPVASCKSTHKLEAADKNGWFTIAPKDDRVRKALRKQSEEKNGETESGVEFFEPAETESLVLAVVDPSQLEQNNRPSGRRGRKRGVPDFRAFRKNSVPSVDRTVTIELRLVGAREVEGQDVFEEHERELAEEQRRADALFRGDSGGGGRKRRRRVD